MKKTRHVFGFVLAIVLIMVLLPFGSVLVKAEEPESDEVVLTAGDYKVGDIIKFGHYEQDGNTANGKEAIEWQILSKDSNRVLVISKYALDCQPYNSTQTDTTWENCSLRKWLNNDFYKSAFSSAEQQKIPVVTIVNGKNPYKGTDGGKNTNDRVFCLSFDELKKYFGNYQIYSDLIYTISLPSLKRWELVLRNDLKEMII